MRTQNFSLQFSFYLDPGCLALPATGPRDRHWPSSDLQTGQLSVGEAQQLLITCGHRETQGGVRGQGHSGKGRQGSCRLGPETSACWIIYLQRVFHEMIRFFFSSSGLPQVPFFQWENQGTDIFNGCCSLECYYCYHCIIVVIIRSSCC